MNEPALVYATDEDVALVAPADVGLLFPADQIVCSGADGVFASSDRWTLTSNSVDFPASGLRDGQVVRLIGPAPQFPAPGALFGVATVGSGGVRLRRLDERAGSGAAVAPPEGLTGVEFITTTLGPQLDRASRELDRLLGIDAEPPNDLDDLDTLREAVVRLVLSRRYLMIDGEGAFQARAAALKSEFDTMIARLFLHVEGDGPGPRFGMRIVR